MNYNVHALLRSCQPYAFACNLYALSALFTLYAIYRSITQLCINYQMAEQAEENEGVPNPKRKCISGGGKVLGIFQLVGITVASRENGLHSVGFVAAILACHMVGCML